VRNFQNICVSKIDEIASLLVCAQKQDIGLLSGSAGISLFLFYYARYKNIPFPYQPAINHLDFLFSQIEEMPKPPLSFCSGVSGVGWLLDHLCRQGFLQAEPDEMLLDIDEYLYEFALNELNHGRYDFLHGAMGIVLYFVRRNRKDFLYRFVQSLENLAIWDGDCAKWQTVLSSGTEGFNISLSHGSSAIVLVLCKILRMMPEDDLVRKTLVGAVSYIVRQEISVQQYGSYFPGFSIESQSSLSKTRLAWCYGDLGIATAILDSGIVLHNQEWIDKSIKIFLHAATRRGLQENMVIDAGICHGTAGIALIFNRMYHNTKLPEFKNAAHYWFVETVEMAKFSDGFAGFKTWRSVEMGGWNNSDNLLDGIAGIGLCLLSFVMHEAPAWDECLLLS